jgi:hypothetical protein
MSWLCCFVSFLANSPLSTKPTKVLFLFLSSPSILLTLMYNINIHHLQIYIYLWSPIYLIIYFCYYFVYTCSWIFFITCSSKLNKQIFIHFLSYQQSLTSSSCFSYVIMFIVGLFLGNQKSSPLYKGFLFYMFSFGHSIYGVFIFNLCREMRI